MSLILPYRFKRSSGGGGALVHNQTFSIIASGFGTKSKGAPNAIDYGAAGVGNLDSTWDIAAPNYGGIPGDGGDNTAYLTVNVALPHSNSGTLSGVPHANASVAISGVGSGTGLSPSTDCYFAKVFTWDGSLQYSYWHSYHRVAANWQFGIGSPNDRNFKYYGIAQGNGGIYSAHANMYLCYTTDPTGWMNDTTTEPLCQTLNEDYPGGGLHNPNGIYTWANHDPSTGNAKNFAKHWVRQEILIKWSPSAAVGYIREWHDNTDIWNSIYTSATDSLTDPEWGATNDRSEGLGGYNRDSHPLNRRYWCDVIFDRDANPGRWYVSNSNLWSLGSGILAEPQPWVFWSTTRCDMTFKKGGLSSGPGFAFYVNERDGNQGPFAVTIA